MEYLWNETIHAGPHTRVVGGKHKQSDQPLALKMLQEAPPSERMIQKLRHEYAMLCEAQGPGVVRVLGLLPWGTGVALLLERWGDGSLARLLQKGPLSVENALHLGAGLARAIGHVHRRGIIHRDIKPQNVLVDALQQEVRLIDFGIAIRRDVYVVETAAPENLAGTLAYIAPEQTGRMNRSVDSRAGLYALGATLYQMLTGVLPFELTDLSELLHAHIARTPVPPHERAPAQRIPAAVSAIVLKLMAKSPEHRYQTAQGAARDLERAAHDWAASGRIEPFALGQKDWEDRLRKPSRLYGRERESSALRNALERVAGGAVELLMVSGPSGVGKSALVQELRESVRARQGIFAPGKFDQLQRGTPYLALTQALRALVRRRLADSTQELARWQKAWQEAAGPNGRILVDLIPELVHILGEPPPLTEVGPIEAQNRFRFTVRYFVRATACSASPLVLFLDDLQWADPPSMALLQDVVCDSEMKHLLVLAAYRDNEVELEHPLHGLIKAAGEAGCRTDLCALAPLGMAALSGMVSDMLGRSVQEVQPLVTGIKAKTDGSPFFVEQFLRALHARRMLVRDLESGAWQWDAAQLERAAVMDNVATLLGQKLSHLSPRALRVLAVAASIGARFEKKLVMEAEGLAEDILNKVLEELLSEGLIVSAGESEHEVYDFAHDRIQQAAHEVLTEGEQRIQVHQALARALDRMYGAQAGDAELFAMLYHQLRALSRLETPEERRHVADLCFQGGQRAKKGLAYAEAAKFLRASAELLGMAGWHDCYTATFETHLALAEIEWLAGRTELGEALFHTCMKQAKDRLARGRIAAAWLPLLLMVGRASDALELGMVRLAEFGWHFPKASAELQPFLGAQLARIASKLMAASSEELAAWPRCTDPEAAIAGLLLVREGPIVTIGRPELFPAVCLAMVEHTLLHGASTITAAGAGSGAIIAALFVEDFRLARRLVEFGRLHLSESAGMTAVAIHAQSLTRLYLDPLAAVAEEWRLGAEFGYREGDITFAEACAVTSSFARLLASTPLQVVLSTEQLATGYVTLLIHGPILALRRALVSQDPADSLRAVSSFTSQLTSEVPVVAHSAHGCVAFLALHTGEDALALSHALEIEPLWMASISIPTVITMVFTLCLGSVLFPEKSASASVQIEAHRARLERWTASAPQNFRHLKLLVDACEAWRGGRYLDAEQLFGEAITDAHQNGFLNDEALGLRLFGEYALERGKEPLSRAYLQAACDAYLRWGASVCAVAIRQKHPTFFQAALAPSGALTQSGASNMQATMGTSSSTTEAQVNSQLDAAALFRAAQALSSELLLDALIARMLRLLAQNAGAERAILILPRDSALHIEAELLMYPERLTFDLNETLEDSLHLPGTLVQYVARGQEPVVLSHAVADTRFDDDAYLRAHRPASILAVPLLHQGRLSGVLYLEHSSAPDAFPKARVELVTLLASQAATAVENARLYSQLKAASAQLVRINLELESQVAARTAELQKALSELWSEMDLATKIQTTLLPEDGTYGDYEVAATMRPAEQVGGDYYDMFEAHGRFWVLIGDVSGHGVSAGLIMMMAQTAVRTLLWQPDGNTISPAELLACVNRALCSNLGRIGRGQYMTITALCFEKGSFQYAGLHLDPLVYRAAAGQVERLESSGVWLGVVDDARECLSNDSAELGPEDILLLYTDGLSEARRDGQLVQLDWVEHCLVEAGQQQESCRRLVHRVFAGLSGAVCKDDVTVLALRRMLKR